MLLLGDSMIVIFGGIESEGNHQQPYNHINLLNDLHILNLKEMHWI